MLGEGGVCIRDVLTPAFAVVKLEAADPDINLPI